MVRFFILVYIIRIIGNTNLERGVRRFFYHKPNLSCPPPSGLHHFWCVCFTLKHFFALFVGMVFAIFMLKL